MRKAPRIMSAGFALTCLACIAAPVPGLDMIRVEGGSFLMGDTTGSGALLAGLEPRRVQVSTFEIGRTEVTQGEWERLLGPRPLWQPAEESADRPVFALTWYDAIAFCNALSLAEGHDPAYIIDGNGVHWDRRSNGYRLPTASEWEYAAKGGVPDQPWPFAGSDDPDEVGWYGDNSNRLIHPVAQKRPNALGIYDMTGNVGERLWNFDGPLPPEGSVDPFGPLYRSQDDTYAMGFRNRTKRGGSAGSDPFSVFGWVKTSCVSNNKSNGFRVARSLETLANVDESPVVPPIRGGAIPSEPSGMITVPGRVVTCEGDRNSTDVIVPAYHLAAREVTVGEFRRFVEATAT